MSKQSLPSRIVHTVLAKLSLDREISAFRNYYYDYKRFKAHSSAWDKTSSDEAIAALITKDYHRLEKGMALPEPRPGFGQGTIDYLLKAVPLLESRRGPCVATSGARGSMRRYVEFHDAMDAAKDVRDDLRAFVEADPELDRPGGTVTLSRDEIAAATDFDFERFVRTRYSVRQFTGAPVAAEAIEQAVALALKTPRVCNRESRRVRVAYDPEVRAKLLSFQNGNRGFADRAGAVVVITSDLRHFTDLGERNQAWIDGGLFAMSLAYALHAAQLGTCFLNWSAPFYRDAAMRKAFNIPDHEAVITYLAVGHLPEELVLAESPAPVASDILTVLK